MPAERDFGGYEGLEIVAVVVGGAAAPFGIGGRRRILRVARGGLGRFFWKHVVERSVQGLLDLGAAAEVPVEPVFLAGLEAVAGTACHVGALAAGLFAVD